MTPTTVWLPMFYGRACGWFMQGTEPERCHGGRIIERIESLGLPQCIAFQDLSDSLVGYHKSRESIAARNRAIKALQTTVRLSFLKLEEGQESDTADLTAENDLYAAQLEAIDTRFRAFASIVGLYKALGGGWTLDVGPDPALTLSPERAKETAAAATGG